jgi:signal transduction histidine kinase
MRELERALKLKSDLLALAAHELRAPLTVIRGYTEMILADDFQGQPLPRSVAEAMSAKVDEMAAMVERMIESSRVDDGDQPLDRADLDLVELARGVGASVAAVNPEHQIYIDAPPTLPLCGDRVRLAAILRILLDNAVRYSPPGSAIECHLSGADQRATVAVTDHGPGIPPEHLGRLFGRFQRLPGAGRGGTGLGLYVAREQARAHGGDITVTSAPGRGSTFTLTLPRSPSEAGRGQPAGARRG